MEEDPVTYVEIIFQGETIPDIHGDIKFVPASRIYESFYTPTEHHMIQIDPIVKNKIRELYNIEEGDEITYSELNEDHDSNKITYAVFRRGADNRRVRVIRGKKQAGGKRVRKNKGKTRRLRRLGRLRRLRQSARRS